MSIHLLLSHFGVFGIKSLIFNTHNIPKFKTYFEMLWWNDTVLFVLVLVQKMNIYCLIQYTFLKSCTVETDDDLSVILGHRVQRQDLWAHTEGADADHQLPCGCGGRG